MNTLGIIGGMGPMAGAHFLNRIIHLTNASADQQHLKTILLNDPMVPDRTAYILDKHAPNPLPALIHNASLLETMGADCLCMTCITAHYYLPDLKQKVHTPFISCLDVLTKRLQNMRLHKIGILATSGTIYTKLLQNICEKQNILPILPSDAMQQHLMEIIYHQIKADKPVNQSQFSAILDELSACGAEKVILGCTELSLIHKEKFLNFDFIDLLEIMAEEAVFLSKRSF